MTTYSYEPTAEMPLRPERQTNLLKTLRSPAGCLDDVVEVLYTEAHMLNSTGQGAYRACEETLEDHDTTREMPDLIKLIPRRVLEALIDNTIGHQYDTDPDFRKLILSLDATAGVYINTFVVRGRGKGLTAEEWENLQTMERVYMEGANCIVDDTSSDSEKQRALVAARIEQVGNIHKDMETALKATMAGHRVLIQKKGKGNAFRAGLDDRINYELDPTGKVHQLQVPVLVGCSKHLNSRLPKYHPKVGMKNSPLVWRLTMSCLHEIGLDIKIISIPILKVWSAVQLSLAEIMVTNLAGSLIEQGGFNPMTPGGNDVPERENLDEEGRQNFIEQSWAMTNVQDVKKVALGRQNIICSMDDMCSSMKLQNKIKKGLVDTQDLGVATAVTHEETEKAIQRLKDEMELLHKHNEKLETQTLQLESSVDFESEVDAWLAD
ncbi:hypothetical protein VTL71DRAFT_3037 [Oculimacula yallundae]|uniref:Uncharacterized protein n=1 Tax=Oculimacula yallundae TaxID=86028 RepID=A0ABR4C6V3_9HELO